MKWKHKCNFFVLHILPCVDLDSFIIVNPKTPQIYTAFSVNLSSEIPVTSPFKIKCACKYYLGVVNCSKRFVHIRAIGKIIKWFLYWRIHNTFHQAIRYYWPTSTIKSFKPFHLHTSWLEFQDLNEWENINMHYITEMHLCLGSPRDLLLILNCTTCTFEKYIFGMREKVAPAWQLYLLPTHTKTP